MPNLIITNLIILILICFFSKHLPREKAFFALWRQK